MTTRFKIAFTHNANIRWGLFQKEDGDWEAIGFFQSYERARDEMMLIVKGPFYFDDKGGACDLP